MESSNETFLLLQSLQNPELEPLITPCVDDFDKWVQSKWMMESQSTSPRSSMTDLVGNALKTPEAMTVVLPPSEHPTDTLPFDFSGFPPASAYVPLAPLNDILPSPQNVSPITSSASLRPVPHNARRGQLTEEELDKRRRNTAASARFRAKKKQRDTELKQQNEQLTEKCDKLARRVKELEVEVKWLRQLVTDQKESSALSN